MTEHFEILENTLTSYALSDRIKSNEPCEARFKFNQQDVFKDLRRKARSQTNQRIMVVGKEKTIYFGPESILSKVGLVYAFLELNVLSPYFSKQI